MLAASRPGPIGLALLALAGAAAALMPLPDILRLIFGSALVLYLPGAAILIIAVRRPTGTLEHLVTSLGLSIAVTVLVGFPLNGLGALNARGWASALCLVTLAACAIAALSSRQRSAEPGPPATPVRVRPMQLVLGGLAVLVSATAIVSARQGALAHRTYDYTELWLVPVATSPGQLTLGIRNREKIDMIYSLDIVADGARLAHWPQIAVAAGETVLETVSVPASLPEGQRIEAWLHRNGDRDVTYRKAWTAGLPK